MADLFDGYAHDGFCDEVFAADGAVREHYATLVQRLARMPREELARRERLREAAFRAQGITFTVYGEQGDDEGGLERTFPMDLIPRIIAAKEWAEVERGLIQRVTALNRFLEDQRPQPVASSTVRSCVGAIAVLCLLLAGCGGDGSSAPSTATIPTPMRPGDAGQATDLGPASETASTPAAAAAPAVPAALDWTVPGVGGGSIDGRALAGQDVALWFWTPW